MRSVALLALIVGLVTMIGASDCAKVDQSVTGPQDQSTFLPAPGNDPCIRDCWVQAMDAREEEMLRHRAAIRDCSGDPECIAAENALNEANLRAIKADFFECREACHEQGGGGGGQ